MERVAHFIESRNKVIKPVLLQANSHVDPMIGGHRSVYFPTLWNLGPSMFDVEIVPSLCDEGFRSGRAEHSKEKERCPQHELEAMSKRRRLASRADFRGSLETFIAVPATGQEAKIHIHSYSHLAHQLPTRARVVVNE